MSYYFIAQVRVKDAKEYQKYIDGAGEIFKRYRGEYLTVDNNPKVIEGQWDYTRTVLIKFKTNEEFNEWYNSPDYQQILKHRLNAAECDTILAKGLD